jgi:hypothetical protein
MNALDDDFLAPVPTWRMGALYNDSYAGGHAPARGTIELQPTPQIIVVAQPKTKRKANGHGFAIQRR